jgi:hypothetical protein
VEVPQDGRCFERNTESPIASGKGTERGIYHISLAREKPDASRKMLLDGQPL